VPKWTTLEGAGQRSTGHPQTNIILGFGSAFWSPTQPPPPSDHGRLDRNIFCGSDLFYAQYGLLLRAIWSGWKFVDGEWVSFKRTMLDRGGPKSQFLLGRH